jgi:hypothetical protein
LIWNPNQGDTFVFLAHVEYDEKSSSKAEIEQQISEKFVEDFYYSHFSASESVLFSVFVVDHILTIRNIIAFIKKIQGVKLAVPLIYYNAIVLDPLSRLKLELDLVRMGLWESTESARFSELSSQFTLD